MYNPHAEILERFDRNQELLMDLIQRVNLVSVNADSIKAPASRQDAAKYLGVSLPTLDKIIESGELKAFNIGRQIRIKWSDIEDYVNKKG